jgi:hypothetical protein
VALGREGAPHLGQGGVAPGAEQREYEITFGLDRRRSPISALWLGRDIARRERTRDPADRARRPHLEVHRRLSTRHPSDNGVNNACAKID